MAILKIDMDIKPPERWLNAWIETRKVLLDHLGFTWISYDIFKTTRGTHIYIYIKEHLPDAEINRLQFLLGDDYTRVKINMWRIEHKIPFWNKLFHRVLYRRKAKVIECYYCGAKIPVRVLHKEVKK